MLLGERAQHVLLLPGGPEPAASSSSRNPATRAAVISVEDQPDHVRGQGGGLAQARVDEGQTETGAPAASASRRRCWHARPGTCWNTGGCTARARQVRADGRRRAPARRAGGPPGVRGRSRTPRCRSYWIRWADRRRDLQLLLMGDQATPRSAARPGQRRTRTSLPEVVPRVSSGSAQASRRSRRAGLRFAPLALLPLRLPLRGAPLLCAAACGQRTSYPRAASRNCRCYRDRARSKPGHPPPQLSRLIRPYRGSSRLQGSDLLVAGRAGHAIRGGHGQIGRGP